MSKVICEIEFLGERFTVTDDQGEEHVRAVVLAAEQRLRTIRVATYKDEARIAPPWRVVLMALLSAEEELLATRKTENSDERRATLH
jgi:hypothetical protein